MKITNILLVVLGLFLGLILSIYIVLTAGEMKLLPAIQSIGSIATAFAAVIAFGVYVSTVRRHQEEDSRKTSETYLREALSVLEKAYETFIQQGDNPPANDRLLWLSTARMIVRFQKLRKKVTEKDHVAVADENEEYTRLKFYTLLKGNSNNFSREYFLPWGRSVFGIEYSAKIDCCDFRFFSVEGRYCRSAGNNRRYRIICPRRSSNRSAWC